MAADHGAGRFHVVVRNVRPIVQLLPEPAERRLRGAAWRLRKPEAPWSAARGERRARHRADRLTKRLVSRVIRTCPGSVLVIGARIAPPSGSRRVHRAEVLDPNPFELAATVVGDPSDPDAIPRGYDLIVARPADFSAPDAIVSAAWQALAAGGALVLASAIGRTTDEYVEDLSPAPAAIVSLFQQGSRRRTAVTCLRVERPR